MRSSLQRRSDPLQIILLIILIAALTGTAYYFDVAGFSTYVSKYVLGEARETGKDKTKGAEKGKAKETDKGKSKEPEKPENK